MVRPFHSKSEILSPVTYLFLSTLLQKVAKPNPRRLLRLSTASFNDLTADCKPEDIMDTSGDPPTLLTLPLDVRDLILCEVFRDPRKYRDSLKGFGTFV